MARATKGTSKTTPGKIAEQKSQEILDELTHGVEHEKYKWSYDVSHADYDVLTEIDKNPRVAERFIERSVVREIARYKGQEHRFPLMFDSMEDVYTYLDSMKRKFLVAHRKNFTEADHKYVTLKEAVQLMIRSRLGLMVYETEGSSDSAVYAYDYDYQMYVHAYDVMKKYVARLTGQASAQDVKTFVETISAFGDELCIYQELPSYKIAVKNGVYNALTGALEPARPYLFYTHRLDTRYVENPEHPKLMSGKTYEEIVSDLAVGNPDRIELIHQMMMCALTGHNPHAAIFCLVGEGGDGKSLFMKLLSQVIGERNVKSMAFPDFADKDAVYAASNAALILGPDNPSKVNLSRSLHYLKSMSGHEPVNVTPKYKPSVNAKFSGTIIQVTNVMPNFGESGESIRRRLVMISCEATHTADGTQILSLENDILNPALHEYILSGYFNARFIPWFDRLNRMADEDDLHDHLSNSNTVMSFFEFMYTAGLFDEPVKYIPRFLIPHLYKAYMSDHYGDQYAKTSTTVYTDLKNVMKKLGFVSSVHTPHLPSRSTLTTLEKHWGTAFQDKARAVSEAFELAVDTAKATQSEFYFRDNAKEVKPLSSAVQRINPSRYTTKMGFFDMRASVMRDMSCHADAYTDVIGSEFYEVGYIFDGPLTVQNTPAEVITGRDSALEGPGYPEPPEMTDVTRDTIVDLLIKAREWSKTMSSLGSDAEMFVDEWVNLKRQMIISLAKSISFSRYLDLLSAIDGSSGDDILRESLSWFQLYTS